MSGDSIAMGEVGGGVLSTSDSDFEVSLGKDPKVVEDVNVVLEPRAGIHTLVLVEHEERVVGEPGVWFYGGVFASQMLAWEL